MHTKEIKQLLKNNEGSVAQYFALCRNGGRLPSCSHFIQVMRLDWSKYDFSRSEITEYLRKGYKVWLNQHSMN